MAQSDDNGRLQQRDWDMWGAYCRGATQQALALKYKISQTTVSERLKRVRESIPAEDKDQVRRRHLDSLAKMAAELWELVEADPVPAFSNGRPILIPDPDDPDGDPVPAMDHSGRLAAMDRIGKFQEREAKLIGLDAATETNVSVEDRRPRELLDLLGAARAAVEAEEADLKGEGDV